MHTKQVEVMEISKAFRYYYGTNKTFMSKDLGVSRNTLDSYLDEGTKLLLVTRFDDEIKLTLINK